MKSSNGQRVLGVKKGNSLSSGIFIRQLLFPTSRNEHGNILVTSLLILLVMNLLGIGLINISTKEWTMATYKTVDSELFHATDAGCMSSINTYFSTATSTPTSTEILALANSSGGSASENISSNQSLSSQVTTDVTNKLDNYNYTCGITYLLSKEAVSGRTSGEEVGNSGGAYDLSGNKVIKDYYKIVSTGTGPKNSYKVINSIISVEY